ncbi:hypothetical protein [Erythrobacter longus]|nr:hypothetical protein [Erythrobacter longus]
MKPQLTNTFAAIAAAILAFTSIGTIVTVPPAHASGAIAMAELA